MHTNTDNIWRDINDFRGIPPKKDMTIGDLIACATQQKFIIREEVRYQLIK
ncbi:MAG: hypothetical protein AAFO07_03730 [Bacteroidota bacterium]